MQQHPEQQIEQSGDFSNDKIDERLNALVRLDLYLLQIFHFFDTIHSFPLSLAKNGSIFSNN